MSLPDPKLDDRTWKDIADEAKSLIPQYCPQWTDFNESDPGITLIELMAFMTDQIMYRLNRVPEKNFIKFLELMGVSLKPREPSQAWVVFRVADGVGDKDLKVIPKGTKLNTGNAKGAPIVFETVDPLYLMPSKIKKVYSRYKEKYEDLTDKIEIEINTDKIGKEKEEKEAPIFLAEKEGKDVPHILYLGLSHLEPLGKEHQFKIVVKAARELPSPLKLEWEYWDKEKGSWAAITIVRDDTFGFTRSGEIIFAALPVMGKKIIDGKSSTWISARICLSGDEALPELLSIKKAVELKPEYGLKPDKGFSSIETTYYPIEFSMEFYPFWKEPKQSDVFYLSSGVFSKKGTTIFIKLELSERYTPDRESLKDIEVHWEYYSETGSWKLLGKTTPTGVIQYAHGFLDETKAFTQTGTMSFICPVDIETTPVQGEENFWIRARIERGKYDIKKSHPPLIKRLIINFKEEPQDFAQYLSYNDFCYRDLTHLVKEEKLTRPFEISSEDSKSYPENPTFYLAFDSVLRKELHRIYLRLTEEKGEGFKIVWEYYSDRGWKELKVHKDSTHAFTHGGAIEFLGNSDWEKKKIFEEEGYWLRVKYEENAGKKSPGIRGVYLNAVKVIQGITIRDEILGSSDGEANQTFYFTKSPIISKPRIWVREVENPHDDLIRKLKQTLKEKVHEEKNLKTDEVIALWIEWVEVENFYNSNDESRHYTFDPYKEIVAFGNGQRGMIPPIGKTNIKCSVYRVGGGERGNVEKNTITILETGESFIEKVTNPEPAGGGAEAETIEEAKLRGPWELKHRYRAVTEEDFKALAKEASGEVAKAECYVEDGTIIVIIVPKVPKKDKATEIFEPDRELIDKVQHYLDECRLITTIVKVNGPKFIDFRIQVKVYIKHDTCVNIGKNIIKKRIEENLEKYFHPLRGGDKGDGWQLGSWVHESEIYHVIEAIDEVYYAEDLKLKNLDQKISEKGDEGWIEIKKGEYPHLNLKESKIEFPPE